MFSVPSYSNNTLTYREKAGQLFMPAAFINDSEEEIQKLERLIREHHVGGLCFFHSRASAATNFEKKSGDTRQNESPGGDEERDIERSPADSRLNEPVARHQKSKGIPINAEIPINENSFETLKNRIQRYQKAAKYPLLIAIDAEWGLAMRIENTPQYPYAITLGALADDQNDLIYEMGRNIARDCRAAGIHWNLAPCVDINNNPNNPVIGYRSFGENRSKVVAKASAFMKGMQSEGILTSIKHFPGHGDTATDSHLALPLIDKTKQELLENELHPFRKLIAEGADSVMVGHLSVPALADRKTTSASLSQEIIQGILRTEMGYDGVVISDALNMHAVAKNHSAKGELEWLAFEAGNDVLCFTDHVAEGVETLLKIASENQIEGSFQRVWRLKEKVQSYLEARQDSASPENGPPLTDADALNQRLASHSLTLFRGSEQAIAEFRASDFLGISISGNSDNYFFASVRKNVGFKSISSFDGFVEAPKNILLAVFPPQVKPKDGFGFSREELIFINELVQTKNVVLYLFGNPYMLNLIDFEKARAVVIAYQKFEVFQKTAANHFLGNLRAKGKFRL